MRVNVYSEELTEDIEIIEPSERNHGHYGIRFYLASSPALDCEEGDDDRSAVTFWVEHREQFYWYLNNMSRLFADYEAAHHAVAV